MATDQPTPSIRLPAQLGTEESLTYFVELWGDNPDRPETVLARVHSVSLGAAVFKASQAEYPGRRITLRYGSRYLSDSAA